MGGSGTAVDGGDTAPGAQPTASVERLDMRNTSAGWDESVAPMLHPRYRHAAAVARGKLYACGGQRTNGKATASVERYEPATDSWQEVAPMLQPRFSHAMAQFEERLYAVGGFANGVWLSSVERYDPELDAWEMLADLDAEIGAPSLAFC